MFLVSILIMKRVINSISEWVGNLPGKKDMERTAYRKPTWFKAAGNSRENWKIFISRKYPCMLRAVGWWGKLLRKVQGKEKNNIP